MMRQIKELLETLQDPRRAVILAAYDVFLGAHMQANPASVKQHHSEVGGFYRHIMETMNVAITMRDALEKEHGIVVSRDSTIIAAFVHDFDKINRYKDSESWRKQEKYGSQMFEYDNSKVSMNATVETLKWCNHFGFTLTDDELNAVSYHHGGWAPDCNGTGFPKSVQDMTYLAVILHSADMVSAKMGERTK